MNTTDFRLSDLDPARDLTNQQLDPHADRARVMLTEITATDPAAPPRTQRLASLRPRRLVPAVGLGIAVLVGGVVGPAALGLNGASAQWVAMPTGVSADDAKAAAEPCRDLLEGPGSPPAASGLPTGDQIRALPVVVAEDRGNWRFVVLSDGRWEASCLQQRSTFSRMLGLLGVESGYSGGGGVTSLDSFAIPSAREVRTVHLMGTRVSGALQRSSTVSAVTGRVGADVIGVVVEPVGHPKVTATVTNGWFAAWWPEPDTSSGGIPPEVAVTVTLRDGTTVHFAAGSEQATPMVGTGTSS